ncbi:MAG: pentapeptide repeat-containing protein [Gammaproteobacteria bacterium]|nr:pentapeptide repeat-containing protein [Gammaproteobacteria bacterium]MDH5799171.1 pentapeptide repeat-containing protein [Gammaproteobacteria bacterium]
MPEKKWYTRRGREIRGPYPEAEIQRFLLLGRITPEDNISVDQFNWRTVADLPHLIPEELTLDLSVAENRERLEARRRKADERAVDRRQQYRDPIADRRTETPSPSPTTLMGKNSPSRELVIFRSLFTLLLLGVGVYAGLVLTGAESPQPADCFVPAAPGVNWSYCVMDSLQLDHRNLQGMRLDHGVFRNADFSGADLNGADLSHSHFTAVNFNLANLNRVRLAATVLTAADLSGADLRAVDLSGAVLPQANLRQADLRGADLRGAILTGAKMESTLLDGAKLDGAVWVDKRVCGPNSVGICRLIPDG